jgi:hypothetical protein
LNFIKNVFCFFVFVIFEQNTRKRVSCFFNLYLFYCFVKVRNY